jgi:hypothetical protein
MAHNDSLRLGLIKLHCMNLFAKLWVFLLRSNVLIICICIDWHVDLILLDKKNQEQNKESFYNLSSTLEMFIFNEHTSTLMNWKWMVTRLGISYD